MAYGLSLSGYVVFFRLMLKKTEQKSRLLRNCKLEWRDELRNEKRWKNVMSALRVYLVVDFSLFLVDWHVL